MSSSWSRIVKKTSNPSNGITKKDQARTEKVTQAKKPDGDVFHEDEHSHFWTRSHLEDISYEIMEYCRNYAPTLLESGTSYDLVEIMSEYIRVPNPFQVNDDKGIDELQTEDDYY